MGDGGLRLRPEISRRERRQSSIEGRIKEARCQKLLYRRPASGQQKLMGSVDARRSS